MTHHMYLMYDFMGAAYPVTEAWVSLLVFLSMMYGIIGEAAYPLQVSLIVYLVHVCVRVCVCAACSYQVIRIRCVLYDGEWVRAETLSAGPAFLGDPWTSKPTQRYLNLLQEGEMLLKSSEQSVFRPALSFTQFPD